MTDDLDPSFAALAAEARRLEPRVFRAATRTSRDYKTVLILETAGLTTSELGALSDALKSFRRREDLIAEFLIVNTTRHEAPPNVPNGWPP